MTNQLESEKIAGTLVEALGWIRQFRDKMVVIKLDGNVIEDESLLESVLLDVHFMQTVGFRPVVVHGGGPKTLDTIRQATNETRLKVAEELLIDGLNRQLSQRFENIGGRAMTLSFQSTPVLTGEFNDADPHFGKVTEVDRLVIDNLCYAGQVPFIPAMCETEDDGKVMIVDATAAASIVASELNAEKLIMVCDDFESAKDELGVNDDATLDRDRAQKALADKSFNEQLKVELRYALESLDNGVQKVHLVDSQQSHGLLLEVYTDQGMGTLID